MHCSWGMRRVAGWVVLCRRWSSLSLKQQCFGMSVVCLPCEYTLGWYIVEHYRCMVATRGLEAQGQWAVTCILFGA